MDLFDYSLDEDQFAEDGGVSEVTKAYAKVFENIKEIAERGEAVAAACSGKEIASVIQQLSNKTAALVQLSQLDKKIVGPTGQIFDVFGKTIDDGQDGASDGDQTIGADDFADRINKIVNGTTDIDLSEAINAAKQKSEKRNVEDDGKSHGELDDIDW